MSKSGLIRHTVANLAHSCRVLSLLLISHCLLKVHLQFEHNMQQCVNLFVMHGIVFLDDAKTLCLTLQVIKQLKFLLNLVDLKSLLCPYSFWYEEKLCEESAFCN